jgi:hypothetical protein
MIDALIALRQTDGSYCSYSQLTGNVNLLGILEAAVSEHDLAKNASTVEKDDENKHEVVILLLQQI